MTAKLGVCGEECPQVNLSPYENKIGGCPDQYSTIKSDVLPVCRRCSRPLLLLVQVYCPLEGSKYHRLIHTYCCGRRECWSAQESWLVLRSQMVDTGHGTSNRGASDGANCAPCGGKAGLNMGVGDWCDGADEWDWNSAGDGVQVKAEVPGHAAAVPCKAVEIALTEEFKSSKPCGGRGSCSGPCFPSFYIDVFEEADEEERSVPRLPKRYEAEADDAGDEDRCEECSWSGEKYEKTVAKHGDKVFQRFHKAISKWPEQILRYHYSGCPLFLRSTANSFKPEQIKCKHCGSSCVYEFQLMPTLVYILQKSAKEKLGNSGTELPLVEFGTIIVYTCSSNCWDENSPHMREEQCFVQFDPDESLVNAFPSLR